MVKFQKKQEHEDQGSAEDRLRRVERAARLSMPDLVIEADIFNLMADLIRHGASPVVAFHWMRRVKAFHQRDGGVVLETDAVTAQWVFVFLEWPLRRHFKTQRICGEYYDQRRRENVRLWLRQPGTEKADRDIPFIRNLMENAARGQFPAEPPVIEGAPWAYCTYDQARERRALTPLGDALKAMLPRRRLDYIDQLIRFQGWPSSVFTDIRAQTRAELST